MQDLPAMNDTMIIIIVCLALAAGALIFFILALPREPRDRCMAARERLNQKHNASHAQLSDIRAQWIEALADIPDNRDSNAQARAFFLSNPAPDLKPNRFCAGVARWLSHLALRVARIGRVAASAPPTGAPYLAARSGQWQPLSPPQSAPLRSSTLLPKITEDKP